MDSIVCLLSTSSFNLLKEDNEIFNAFLIFTWLSGNFFKIFSNSLISFQVNHAFFLRFVNMLDSHSLNIEWSISLGGFLSSICSLLSHKPISFINSHIMLSSWITFENLSNSSCSSLLIWTSFMLLTSFLIIWQNCGSSSSIENLKNHSISLPCLTRSQMFSSILQTLRWVMNKQWLGNLLICLKQ